MDNLNNQKDKYNYYYDAMEYLTMGDVETAEELLGKALEIDIMFVDAYNGLSYVYREMGNKKRVEECIRVAFYITKKKFYPWSDKMIWGYLENRQYLRAIFNMAAFYHEKGKKEEAEKLYKLLLKMNPNDNQGVRYLLAALYANKSPKIADELIEKGNALQDGSEIEELLEQQNKKYQFWEYPED